MSHDLVVLNFEHIKGINLDNIVCTINNQSYSLKVYTIVLVVTGIFYLKSIDLL